MNLMLLGGLALALVAVVLVFALGAMLGGSRSGPAHDDRAERPEPAAAPAGSAGGPGAPDPGVLAALQAGNKILAIKLYRERTGASLKASKEAVDALERGERAPAAAPGSGGDPLQDSALLAAMAAGRKIVAVKRYRELTGASLREAKDAVDSLG